MLFEQFNQHQSADEPMLGGVLIEYEPGRGVGVGLEANKKFRWVRFQSHRAWQLGGDPIRRHRPGAQS